MGAAFSVGADAPAAVAAARTRPNHWLTQRMRPIHTMSRRATTRGG